MSRPAPTKASWLEYCVRELQTIASVIADEGESRSHVLRMLIDELEPSHGALKDDAVSRANEYLQSHYDHAITEAKLARTVGSSVKALRKGFRDRWGQAPMARLRAIRMHHALELLTTTDVKVEAIALSVGFRSKATLYRQMTHWVSRTPAAFRASLGRDRGRRE